VTGLYDNDIGASGEWQKIDNSSVLSGVGTGQTVALWEGASSVTDSETLGNAPITVSGNNAIFAGDINLAAGKKLQYSANSFMTPENNVSGAEISTAGTFIVKTGTTPTLGLTLDASQNATFAGNVTLTGDLTGTDATFSSLTIDYYKAAFAGDIELNGANKYIYFRTGTDSGLWQEDNFSLRFGTNNVERMRIDSSGKVGIGTISPLVKLQIEGSAMPATTDPASVEDILTLYRNGSATVWSGGATLALGRYSTGGSSAPKSRLDFKLKGAIGSNTALPETTVMTMNSDGNVGIGTTLPSTDLQVAGTVRADVFGVQDDSTNPSGNTSTRVTSPAGATYDDQSNSASTGYYQLYFLLQLLQPC